MLPLKAKDRQHMSALYRCYRPKSGTRIGFGPDKSFIVCLNCRDFIIKDKSFRWPKLVICGCGYETRTK